MNRTIKKKKKLKNSELHNVSSSNKKHIYNFQGLSYETNF